MRPVSSGARWLPVAVMLALVGLSGCTALLMGGGSQGGGSGGPTGAGASTDTMILEQVRRALAADTSVDGSNIAVEVSRQVVSLSGSVPSAAQRVRAGEIAGRVGQVAAVRNFLRVPTQ